jgi:hypothetical protein
MLHEHKFEMSLVHNCRFNGQNSEKLLVNAVYNGFFQFAKTVTVSCYVALACRSRLEKNICPYFEIVPLYSVAYEAHCSMRHIKGTDVVFVIAHDCISPDKIVVQQ